MYTTPSKVRGALTPSGSESDLSTAAGFSDVQLNATIIEAQAVVDSYLSSQYPVPLPAAVLQPDGTAPEPVGSLTRDIAAYYATLTYRRGKDITETDPVVRRYNAAINLLARLASGQSTIPGLENPAGGGGDMVAVVNVLPDIFGQEDLMAPPLAWSAGTYSTGFWQGPG